MTLDEEVLLTKEECEEAIAIWQKLLSLEDWTVYLSYFSSDESTPVLDILNEDTTGRVHGYANVHFPSKKIALTILYPTKEHRVENSISKWDMERTIVHELMHVHYAAASQSYNGGTDYDTKSIVLLEQAVEATATALVAAKRGLYAKIHSAT